MSIVDEKSREIKHNPTAIAASDAPASKDAPYRRTLAFACVLAGILANWFWYIGWMYLADPTQPLQVGPPLALAVRVALSVFATAITFMPTYQKVQTVDTWMLCILAFQSGFFWQSAFNAIALQFRA